ncbi:MAG: hypothetical protein IPN49_00295 [Saprospiraceae bacterium]|nr:hypothetical protein [Saprospiraceae bacterium]MBK7523008.1 hypothetical protein [Saprospiraceae bacterium]MBK8817588.1 hypothetical protein [Saprospiraceae bacterium]MBK9044511.1 hypothetical protein [Saprospiraceae bacterium]
MRIPSIILTFFLIATSCEKDKQPLTFETGTLTDTRDGQSYATVKIGNQWWMAEDLNYNAYNSWYYNNDSITYATIYGRLYLWATAMNGQASSSTNPSNVQGIGPAGWHIPSDAEWIELTTFLSNNNLTGDDLKEMGNAHWQPTNNGTNLAKFNAVPSGTVYNNGVASANINRYVTYISSTIDTVSGGVWGHGLEYNKSTVRRIPIGLQNGWSVRCVKDE